MKNPTQLILLLISLMLLSSCSISFDKRRYRPGYHIEMVSKKRSFEYHVQKERRKDRKDTISTFAVSTIEHSANVDLDIRNDEWQEQRTNHSKEEKKNKKPKQVLSSLDITQQHLDEECDEIRLVNGKIIRATGIEIRGGTLTYKNCGDNQAEPTPITLNRIRDIKLKNGSVIDPYKEYRMMYEPSEHEKGRRTRGAMAWVFGGIAIVVLAAGLALCLSSIGGGWGGILLLLIGIILLAIGVVLGIIGIILGVTTPAKKN